MHAINSAVDSVLLETLITLQEIQIAIDIILNLGLVEMF